MEFGVGDRPGRRADGLSVHADHETDEGPGAGERLEDVVPLVVQLGPADLDKPDVMGARVKDQAFAEGRGPDPLTVEIATATNAALDDEDLDELQ